MIYLRQKKVRRPVADKKLHNKDDDLRDELTLVGVVLFIINSILQYYRARIERKKEEERTKEKNI